MKKIGNLEDLRYRKLYLRSEIKLKEQKLGNQITELKAELNSTDFKNEIMRSAMNNPALMINVARITYNLVSQSHRDISHRLGDCRRILPGHWIDNIFHEQETFPESHAERLYRGTF